MSTVTETTDAQVLELLRRRGALSVSELVAEMGVTPTAVRQRLARLQGQGLLARETERAVRGRPKHRYGLTEKARRQSATNYGDLAVALWEEIRAVKDPEVRRGLLVRLASRLESQYRDRIQGTDTVSRMESLKALFAERRIPLEVDATAAGGPVLKVLDCPYPELAEQDRTICAVEKVLFSNLLDEGVRLSGCRLDGHGCCEFGTT
jgi:predicted ArsR family transcriptional regulator